jgi:ABC-type transport system involved in multi-copper enzyme maturation permease subunit
MWKRWGMGPVFVYESLLNARRWQVYAGRSLFVLVILVGMTIVWITRNELPFARTTKMPTHMQLAKLGEWFFYVMAGIQVSLVLLAAPAAAAGSICIDRARGTLLHVMVTDLSDTEIVLGKLGARLAPVIGLIACGVPVACLSALLGGIEFGAIAGSFVVSLSLAALVCTLALTISVWATKAHEVLMAVYMILGFWLMALPIWMGMSGGKIIAPPEWFQKANPYVLVFAPFYKPGFTGPADFAAFTGIVLTFSAALAILSIVRIRRVVVQQSGRPQKERRRRLPALLKRVFPSWPSPQLDGNPVLWREWSRNRPSKLARRLWALLLLIIWASMAWGTYEAINEGTGPSSSGFEFGFMMLLLFGFLMLSATAPTALAEERALGSLDALLATPLSTRSILMAKWWGMYRRVLVLALVPLYAGFFMAATAPDVPVWFGNFQFPRPLVPLNNWDRVIAPTFCLADFLASGALIVSWGLVLATWVPRLGRAVALSVIVYFLLAIGWPLLIELLFSKLFFPQVRNWYEQSRVLHDCLMSFSSLGSMSPISELQGFGFRARGPLWIGLGTVILIKFAIAGLLFWLTAKTFDRCLGRISESRFLALPWRSAVHKELVPSATY